MSNLTLPRMTYVTLNGLLVLANARLQGRTAAKIAYETRIERGPDKTVVVYHHGNPIAQLGPDWFTLTGAGWISRTTADRLNRILRDNQTPLPAAPTERLYYTASARDNLKERGLFIVGYDTTSKPHLLAEIQHGLAHFSRVDELHHYVLHG